VGVELVVLVWEVVELELLDVVVVEAVEERVGWGEGSELEEVVLV
jgi:hypothetical protein